MVVFLGFLLPLWLMSADPSTEFSDPLDAEFVRQAVSDPNLFFDNPLQRLLGLRYTVSIEYPSTDTSAGPLDRSCRERVDNGYRAHVELRSWWWLVIGEGDFTCDWIPTSDG